MSLNNKYKKENLKTFLSILFSKSICRRKKTYTFEKQIDDFGEIK